LEKYHEYTDFMEIRDFIDQVWDSMTLQKAALVTEDIQILYNEVTNDNLIRPINNQNFDRFLFNMANEYDLAGVEEQENKEFIKMLTEIFLGFKAKVRKREFSRQEYLEESGELARYDKFESYISEENGKKILNLKVHKDNPMYTQGENDHLKINITPDENDYPTNVLIVSGRSASGKSTLVECMKKELEEQGYEVIIPTLDGAYGDRKGIKGMFNFDHPFAIRWDYVYDALCELIKGNAAWWPTYDFTTHGRGEFIKIGERDPNDKRPRIVLLEGIFAAIESELSPHKLLRQIFPNYKGFLDVKVSTPDMICLFRRAIRDMKERGRNLESIFDQWCEDVQRMYKEFEVSQEIFDLVFDGGSNIILKEYPDWVRNKIIPRLEQIEKDRGFDFSKLRESLLGAVEAEDPMNPTFVSEMVKNEIQEICKDQGNFSVITSKNSKSNKKESVTVMH